MRIFLTKNYDEMSKRAADLIASAILLNPNCTLGLATGSTPIGTYQELIKKYRQGILDFSGLTTVNLDEYKGLAPDNPQSYRFFMQSQLFNHVNIDISRTFVPDGLNEDSNAECERYEQIIKSAGGIDLQLLGMGPNGHIGFNEPDVEFIPETHCVKLTQSTIDANKRFFEKEEDVPRFAYTMGIRTIMLARKILIIVNGEKKAQIVKDAFFGPITPKVPASVLRLHPDVILVGDEAALSLI